MVVNTANTLSVSSTSSMEEIEKTPWMILFSHPLFSCFISLYSIILLYFPQDSLRILISPVPLFAGAFLISFLRFGSSNSRPGSNESSIGPELETGLDSNLDFIGDFVEWNLKLGAPLEVIHEEEDEDEEEEPLMTGVKDSTRFVRIERFTSSSMFKPESDSELDREFPVMGIKDSTRLVTTERFPSSSTLKPEFKLDSGSELDSDFPVMDDLIEIKLDDGCRNKKIKHHQIFKFI